MLQFYIFTFFKIEMNLHFNYTPDCLFLRNTDFIILYPDTHFVFLFYTYTRTFAILLATFKGTSTVYNFSIFWVTSINANILKISLHSKLYRHKLTNVGHERTPWVETHELDSFSVSLELRLTHFWKTSGELSWTRKIHEFES